MQCSICLEDIDDVPNGCKADDKTVRNESKAVRTLSCMHTFHETCIEEWFAQSDTCPVCRSSALPPPQHVNILGINHLSRIIVQDSALGHLTRVNWKLLIVEGINQAHKIASVVGLRLSTIPLKWMGTKTSGALVRLGSIRWSCTSCIVSATLDVVIFNEYTERI